MSLNRGILMGALAAGAAVLAWGLSRGGRVLDVAVHEGKVLVETPKGEVRVPAGAVARGSARTAPGLLAEAAAEEKWRRPLESGESAAAEPDLSGLEPAWKRALEEKLSKPVAFNFPGVAFADALAFFGKQGGISLHVARPARELAPNLEDVLVTLASPPEGLPLASALNLLTGTVPGLGWVLKDEVVVISAGNDLLEPAVVAVFDVRDLLGPDSEKEEDLSRLSGDQMVELLKQFVDRRAWEHPEYSLSLADGKLLSKSPAGTQRRILEVLREFRRFQASEPARKVQAPAPPAWKTALQGKLRESVQYSFSGIPFKDALAFLGTKGGFPVLVSGPVMEQAPGLLEVKVSLASPPGGMTLESALNLLAREAGLSWTLRDGSVVLVAEGEPREPAVLVVYDVRRLVRNPGDGERVLEAVLALADPRMLGGGDDCLQYAAGRIFVSAPSEFQPGVAEVLNRLLAEAGTAR